MPTSPVEPLWLSAEVAISINQHEVAETGEPHVLLDDGKLSGALNRPQMMFHYGGEDDLAAIAVTLLFAIARSHAFLQGNKRTGFTAFVVFLDINGYDFTAPDSERLGEVVTRVVAGNHTEGQFLELIRSYIEPRP